MTPPLRPTLLVISDLWGARNADWLAHYRAELDAFFQVEFIDSIALAALDTTDYSERTLHQQFVNGGIERAAGKLAQQHREAVTILAFSVGGTIAWQAALNGLKINHLFAISATRLRYETAKPSGQIHLSYGALDPNKPAAKWAVEHQLELELVADANHDCYQIAEVARNVCAAILRQNVLLSSNLKQP